MQVEVMVVHRQIQFMQETVVLGEVLQVITTLVLNVMVAEEEDIQAVVLAELELAAAAAAATIILEHMFLIM